MNFLFEIIRYATIVYNTLEAYWNWLCYPYETPTRMYFLSDDYDYDTSYKYVPENTVFIEEWVNNKGERLCYVRYEGEEIWHEGHMNPFKLSIPRAECPWIWIGDKETELELTQAFRKFLIPSNVIRLDLVEKLIHITEDTELVYIDAKTFEVKKFPGDGILIEQNEE